MKSHGPIIMQNMMAVMREGDRIALQKSRAMHLKLVQLYLLYQLRMLGGDASFEELIAVSFLHKSTISQELSRMARKGLVSVYQEPGGMLRKRTALQPMGSELLYVFDISGGLWEERLTSSLPETKQAIFCDLLKTFFRNLCPAELTLPSEKLFASPLISYYFMMIMRCLNYRGRKDDIDDLEINQKYILLQMGYYEGECSYKMLERNLRLAQSCIANQMKKLADRGMVECFKDPFDQRVRRGRLTDAGKLESEMILGRLIAGEQLGCSTMSPQQIKFFGSCSKLIADHVLHDTKSE